ncbi:FAD-dependent oxidoreductase [Thermoleptolyngbya sichuanensis XZ-Cy5]|uniref:FAD-dependent oxidoreductase n=1 Tax=Thermoleptolyngbya sichuanensis TaxID=2885951 RepID=UPI00240D19FB|nr:FAD-dependent oxidoreductase [Thermoleptolyngbya sichuanensis]MDG2617437.1 FAD-dependent oxidoreductase [Thermoleptolyngbya sichuanensis XZ-Cy5]
MPHVLMIGGSDAGISAALRIRELTPETDVTVMLADDFPNFSICGLPFYLSGEVADWRNLAHRTQDDILREGIQLMTNHRAVAIAPDQQQVTAISSTGQQVQVPYDKLIISTGATSRIPRIAGLDLPGVYFLRWMGDSFRVHDHLTTQNPKSAVIIGGGYIGLEMADALTLRGLSVTLVEHSPTVLKTVHSSFGERVAQELQNHGVTVATGISVEGIAAYQGQLRVTGSPNFVETADLVLVAVGAVPAAELAQAAGVALGTQGAIQVNRRMETNVPHIYAAGDCVETWHRLLQKCVYLPLGTTAHKQGRVAGENAVGGDRHFEGTLGTQVVKVFDLAIARTGLREAEAVEAGYAALTADFETWDHKVYYPGAQPLHIRVTGDRHTGQLLGAQILGHYQGEVAKRIDIFATALFHNMTVAQLSDLDLSYTPPLSSPWDPVQMAAQAWVRQSTRTTAGEKAGAIAR